MHRNACACTLEAGWKRFGNRRPTKLKNTLPFQPAVWTVGLRTLIQELYLAAASLPRVPPHNNTATSSQPRYPHSPNNRFRPRHAHMATTQNLRSLSLRAQGGTGLAEKVGEPCSRFSAENSSRRVRSNRLRASLVCQKLQETVAPGPCLTSHRVPLTTPHVQRWLNEGWPAPAPGMVGSPSTDPTRRLAGAGMSQHFSHKLSYGRRECSASCSTSQIFINVDLSFSALST